MFYKNLNCIPIQDFSSINDSNSKLHIQLSAADLCQQFDFDAPKSIIIETNLFENIAPSCLPSPPSSSKLDFIPEFFLGFQTAVEEELNNLIFPNTLLPPSPVFNESNSTNLTFPAHTSHSVISSPSSSEYSLSPAAVEIDLQNIDHSAPPNFTDNLQIYSGNMNFDDLFTKNSITNIVVSKSFLPTYSQYQPTHSVVDSYAGSFPVNKRKCFNGYFPCTHTGCKTSVYSLRLAVNESPVFNKEE
ncbi:hypothetical protein HK099_004039 [Clydaea vesicula]|uniref:Uncharacterized protein n=1 Tax=Clydaea vesicula TaxID=447962 RepID=A0AAD5XZV7_9FUNG|nr:hypothetical protein HK099_004039 [Clydaea vesicula]